MLNYIWALLFIATFLCAGLSGRWEQVNRELIEAAKESVISVALPLLGITVFWLGLIRIAEQAGFVQGLARLLKPLLCHLFPEVPPSHPAFGSMLLNIAANMLGLANAATPLGLRAMRDLQSLNPKSDTATDAMCMFLVLNTSSLQLLPMTAIGILAAAGAKEPTAIIGPTLLATTCSTGAGVLAALVFSRLNRNSVSKEPEVGLKDEQLRVNGGCDSEVLGVREEGANSLNRPMSRPGMIAAAALICLGLFFCYRLAAEQISSKGLGIAIVTVPVSKIAVPFIAALTVLCAISKGIRVYEEFVIGAKEGIGLVVRLVPYLVAMIVAIRVFRASGAMDLIVKAISIPLQKVGFPPELLPMALMRPLSGSASIGLLAELAHTYGGDSLLARMGGMLLGSTETTLYVITVYFGAVGIRNVRYSLSAGLLADLVGVLASVWIARAVW